jgi:hypothetical protein
VAPPFEELLDDELLEEPLDEPLEEPPPDERASPPPWCPPSPEEPPRGW